jgi:hypothetical protein
MGFIHFGFKTFIPIELIVVVDDSEKGKKIPEKWMKEWR